MTTSTSSATMRLSIAAGAVVCNGLARGADGDRHNWTQTIVGTAGWPPLRDRRARGRRQHGGKAGREAVRDVLACLRTVISRVERAAAEDRAVRQRRAAAQRTGQHAAQLPRARCDRGHMTLDPALWHA